MKIIKLFMKFILWISTIILFFVELYLFIMPYIWGKTCIPEEGCMNESGMLIVLGLFLLPLFILLLIMSVISLIRMRKNK